VSLSRSLLATHFTVSTEAGLKAMKPRQSGNAGILMSLIREPQALLRTDFLRTKYHLVDRVHLC